MKEYLGIFAIFLTLFGYAPLLYKIFKGVVKPHPFTWFIWTFATLIVFFAQLLNNGGSGAWAIGCSGSITFVITIFAFVKKSDYIISKIDWFFLFSSVFALMTWFLTNNAVYAVLLLTVVDLLGYGPTIKKAYFRPHEEYVPVYLILSMRNVVSILAMHDMSFINTFFQICTTLANIFVVSIVLKRRKKYSI